MPEEYKNNFIFKCDRKLQKVQKLTGEVNMAR